VQARSADFKARMNSALDSKSKTLITCNILAVLKQGRLKDN
jgi:hypothetical protein